MWIYMKQNHIGIKYMTYFSGKLVKLSYHGDENSARILLMAKLKQLIEANPLIGDKLQFPTLQKSRLETLVKLSFYWQVQQCDTKVSNYKLPKNVLYEDPYCDQGTDSIHCSSWIWRGNQGFSLISSILKNVCAMETGRRRRSTYHGSQMQRITLNPLAFSLRSKGKLL